MPKMPKLCIFIIFFYFLLHTRLKKQFNYQYYLGNSLQFFSIFSQYMLLATHISLLFLQINNFIFNHNNNYLSSALYSFDCTPFFPNIFSSYELYSGFDLLLDYGHIYFFSLFSPIPISISSIHHHN